MKGKLVIIVGPSASGKTDLTHALLERVQNSARLVTTTTRPMRSGEIDGQDYFFVERTVFNQKITEGEFLEHAEVYGNLYGVSKNNLDTFLKKYDYVFAIIDVQGAQTLKSYIPDALTIFIRSGSLEDIQKRLQHVRNDVSQQELKKRLETSAQELAQATTFDAIVENPFGHFDEAVAGVMELLHK